VEIPFFKEMAPAQTVLLAGAGGGFDVFAALPLYFWLRGMGKTVHLANLSFSDLAECTGQRPCPEILKVTGLSQGPAFYFPELALCEWLAKQGISQPVYAIAKSGVQGVARAYRWLVQDLRPDTIVLVDGGTDIVMRGDEAALGTAEEDISSLLGVDCVEGVERKFVACVGFGVDTYHGVCHSLFLENTAALIEDGGFLGSWSMTRDMEEARLYRSAVDYANLRYPDMPSIVNNSVACSTEGWYGDRHFTDRTEGTKLFLNPLMSLYWTFRLESLAARLLYRDQVIGTEDWRQLALAIDKFRDGLPQLREWHSIPH
jgi:hypothetical protein